MVIRGLQVFHVIPNPAKEGQSVTIQFTYPVDKTTLILEIVNWDETVTRKIRVEVSGGKGKGTFVIPKGWGSLLFVHHVHFYTSTISVNP